jgi:hypothetical protein
VVVEELGQQAGGKGAQVARVGRPDRRRLRHDQPLDELPRIAALVEEVEQGGARSVQPHQRRRLAVEAEEVADHAVEGGAQQARAPREQAVRGRAVVLELAPAVAHREAHRGGLRGHPEALEQALEAGVVAVVEDDEAGVHTVELALGLHLDGPGMAARARGGLEHGDLVPRVQEVRAGEAGDAGPDDGDPHRLLIRTGAPGGCPARRPVADLRRR